MSPRDQVASGGGGTGTIIPDFRQAVEERERLMQRDSAGGLPKENGELRKSLESPQQQQPRAPSAGGNQAGLPGMPPGLPPPSNIPGLPPHLNFNPLMFGGLPSLESLRKDDIEKMQQQQPQFRSQQQRRCSLQVPILNAEIVSSATVQQSSKKTTTTRASTKKVFPSLSQEKHTYVQNLKFE